jgi:hypothetical protein
MVPLTGPMAPQTPEEVAVLVADLVDDPMPELYTNPAHPVLARAYYEDVAAFEENAPRSTLRPPPASD